MISLPHPVTLAGDVITYNNPLSPGTTISHRIVKKYLIDGTVPGFVTKGDANKVADVPIVVGNVQGKVIWHVSDVGWWLMAVKKPVVILPIVYFAALLIMIEEIVRLRDYFKLATPYRASGYTRHDPVPNPATKRLAIGSALAFVFVFAGVAFGPSVAALLKSNSVTLTNNRISVTVPPKATVLLSTGERITNKKTSTDHANADQPVTKSNVKMTNGAAKTPAVDAEGKRSTTVKVDKTSQQVDK